eukprot:gnl/TRDRNA2_/TRDRNA2_153735_c1_seq1.p1 gnl/TRDRNA2_/TRDRNA2_153735_c1~~gnl/TRDRNA2_/TRDRNA2_153735_c1_seq1.p1  ORF type:complete len:644 (-),score=116.44 gnl/TRDRNA2_/TRDRNA2_153735_c1_seq1:134-1894(-)
MQVPVVGMTPLRSMEQMAPLLLFCGLQVLEALEVIRRTSNMSANEFKMFRIKLILACGAVGAVVGGMLFQAGYFGPISSRVRGLFVKHTRTGNPLVDSVAEHQATSPQAYWAYLHYICYLAPVGLVCSLTSLTDSKIFMLCYAFTAYYFSSKMSRLVLLLGPISAMLGGVTLCGVFKWCVSQWLIPDELADETSIDGDGLSNGDAQPAETNGKAEMNGSGGKKSGKEATGKKAVGKLVKEVPKVASTRSGAKAARRAAALEGKGFFDKIASNVREALEPALVVYRSPPMQIPRKCASVLVIVLLCYFGVDFWVYSQQLAESMGEPSIMFRARLRGGQPIIVDDYREAYWWLRDNTPEDARVLSWWDYGYQITGIGNRTTLADGNTWNHEHIATLGRILTNAEKKAWNIARHLADYVLVWTNGNGDDIAKSPHMARIGNSVYKDMCPGDPTCMHYTVNPRTGEPTKTMGESLLWKLSNHGEKRGTKVNPKYFEEAYTTKYRFVRIFKVVNISQESKDWVADPANRKCDVPGSWYCPGQYPPALDKLIHSRKAFVQLEDFNAKGKKGDKEAEEYQRQYFEKMKLSRGD